MNIQSNMADCNLSRLEINKHRYRKKNHDDDECMCENCNLNRKIRVYDDVLLCKRVKYFQSHINEKMRDVDVGNEQCAERKFNFREILLRYGEIKILLSE